ncbi:hypothetical protein QJS10_CPB17g00952 [Acorus calamus]|uniref:Uncharacterized protein n=1 Tax=Acorus calamus TaxID=4465 RepID=A0AAV9CYE0_ACOCL|nr:hypothetical protein QJS10_CPB17g00952 [Acorus calamus]
MLSRTIAGVQVLGTQVLHTKGCPTESFRRESRSSTNISHLHESSKAPPI